MSDWPDWLVLAIRIAVLAALLGVIGSLIVTWMRSVQRDADQMNRAMRNAGHVPPETDPEKTVMVPAVRADKDMAHGTHSAGTESIRVGQIRVVRRSDGSIFFQRLNIGEPVEFEAGHHPRIGCVLAAAVVAREGMLT